MRWVNDTLPPRARARWLLMTMRLSASSFAGTARTLVAVGTCSDASMLVTIRAAAPRSGVERWPSLGAVLAGAAFGAGAAAGLAAGASAGLAAGASAGLAAGASAGLAAALATGFAGVASAAGAVVVAAGFSATGGALGAAPSPAAAGWGAGSVAGSAGATPVGR